MDDASRRPSIPNMRASACYKRFLSGNGPWVRTGASESSRHGPKSSGDFWGPLVRGPQFHNLRLGTLETAGVSRTKRRLGHPGQGRRLLGAHGGVPPFFKPESRSESGSFMDDAYCALPLSRFYHLVRYGPPQRCTRFMGWSRSPRNGCSGSPNSPPSRLCPVWSGIQVGRSRSFP